MEIMNKKKNSEIHKKDQLLRRSSLRSLINEQGRSSSGFNSRVSRERADMRRVKRVRFTDPETESLSCKRDPCALPAKGTLLPPSFEEPKTSEYAFYKRLREDASRTYQPYPRNKQDNPSEKFEANNSAGEVTNNVKSLKPDFGIRSMLHVEKVTPTKVKLSHSPPGDSSNSGGHSANLEVFSAKRHKLLQWALEASSIDISQYHSNGYNLVAVLLQRLVPESNTIASSSCTRQRTRLPELNTKSPFPASPDSDIHITELSETPNMNFVSPVVRPLGRYIENGLSDCWSNKPRETSLLQLDNIDVGSQLTGHGNQLHFQYQKRHFDDFVNDGRTSGLPINRESANDVDHLGAEFPFKGCQYLALPMHHRSDFSMFKNLSLSWYSSEKSLGFSNKSSFKELNEVQDANEPVLGEDCTHLLGYDENNLGSEKEFTSHSLSTVMNFDPTSSTSSGDDNWKALNRKFDVNGFHSSSVLAVRQCPDLPLLDFCSESYPNHAFGSQVLEDRDYQVVVSDHFQLNLHSNPNYPALAENSRLSDDLKWSGILQSPRGNWRIMSKVFGEISFPSSAEPQIPSGLNFDVGLESLSVTDSFREHQPSIQDMKILSTSSLTGNINNWCLDSSLHIPANAQFDGDIINTHETHDYSSIDLKISLNKELVYPLLLDNSSWEGSREIFLDYNEDE